MHTVCLCMLHTVSLTICILCKHCVVVSKPSIPLVFPSKSPNCVCVCVCVCVCMHLSPLRTSQIYLSSAIVTTVSSGTLACSTVALSLCGVKCVCSLSQTIALFAPWNSEYICGSRTFVALNYSDSKSQFTQTHSLLLNIQLPESVCVCVCIPVLWKAFSPLHSLMITHTHTHAVGGMFRLGMSSSQQPNYSDWLSDFLIEGL